MKSSTELASAANKEDYPAIFIQHHRTTGGNDEQNIRILEDIVVVAFSVAVDISAAAPGAFGSIEEKEERAGIASGPTIRRRSAPFALPERGQSE
ncbi:hypothetical protein [Benzoatithermus flavus]|uniref:Uncharacterized protein n=1 Tax=Benzoatithermus flavus TaxID=3108223 RepID=A0ABU8XRY6_9PROT